MITREFDKNLSRKDYEQIAKNVTIEPHVIAYVDERYIYFHISVKNNIDVITQVVFRLGVLVAFEEIKILNNSFNFYFLY